jgi:hypothetical protein
MGVLDLGTEGVILRRTDEELKDQGLGKDKENPDGNNDCYTYLMLSVMTGRLRLPWWRPVVDELL